MEWWESFFKFFVICLLALVLMSFGYQVGTRVEHEEWCNKQIIKALGK